MSVKTKSSAAHFTWLEGQADGWVYCNRPNLHVQQELLPADLSEARHRHSATAQFYFVLSGRATLELNGEELHLHPREGIEIPPGAAHKLQNRGTAPLEFLVISSSAPRLDREDLE